MTLVVVRDVNILASGAAITGSLPAHLDDEGFKGRYTIVLSDRMVMKLAEVLTRPYFADKLDRLRREAIVGRTRVSSEVMTPDPSVSGITDDDEDDAVLGTAVAAGADYLVTGDTRRLKFRSYREVQIVTAREFLTLLES